MVMETFCGRAGPTRPLLHCPERIASEEPLGLPGCLAAGIFSFGLSGQCGKSGIIIQTGKVRFCADHHQIHVIETGLDCMMQQSQRLLPLAKLRLHAS